MLKDRKRWKLRVAEKKIEFNNKTEYGLLIERPITYSDSTIKSQVLFR
jgi:hypothetical protein